MRMLESRLQPLSQEEYLTNNFIHVFKAIMTKLTDAQVQKFNDEGYLFFPSLFSEREVDVLTSELDEIFSKEIVSNIREKNSNSVRTAFAVQMYNAVYARLAQHPRMVKPVQDLLNEDVYMHQFKVNAKAAFDGDVWQWHQDFGSWHAGDAMPESRAMNIAIFLDEVNEFNGPLMLIPGSHKLGAVEATLDSTTTSYPLWTLDSHTITTLVNKGGIVAPKGARGSMLLFDSCLVHGSGPNLSPWHRRAVYLSLCATTNHIRRFGRPGFLAHRQFEPINCLPDDCLLKEYETDLPWVDGIPEEELAIMSRTYI